ncbi:MAG: hypothetical protein R3B46_14375 [Phycisphaerales bacterium]
MRVMVYLASLVMASLSLAGYLWHKQSLQREEALVSQARTAVSEIHRVVKYRAATEDATLNQMGWPSTIDPSWFGSRVPTNPLLSRDRPWVEVASSGETKLTDPPIRQVLGEGVAAFWYNPANGIVRARVGAAVSDEKALDLYNEINGTSLRSLFPKSSEWGDSVIWAEAK